jgi:beta-glucosidase
MTFPEGFLWGAATSAYQIEGGVDAGGRGESIWDRFSHTPGKIARGETGDVACDHYHLWRQDVALMAELGIQAYRFSIAWPRVQPLGSGRLNQVGLDFYASLTEGLLEAGIQPFITLYHWDLPQALQDRGGWVNRDTAHYFADYAEQMATRLGDRCSHWITINEPWVAAHLGHELGRHAPGRRSITAALQAGHHLLLGHGLALERLRSTQPSARVGITLNLVPVQPMTDRDADHAATDRADEYYNKWYLEPLFRGSYPSDTWQAYAMAEEVADEGDALLLASMPVVRGQIGPPRDEAPGVVPVVEEPDLQVISRPIDFLGVNYYYRQLIHAGDQHELLGFSFAATPDAASAEGRTAMGWEVYAAGLAEILERVHTDYGPTAIYVTENGAAFADAADDEGFVVDDRRVEYLRSHVASLGDAVAAGVPVRGYFAWSLLDNFEWDQGYSMRFGLVRVDYENGRRIPKASALWYRSHIAGGG